MLQDMKPELNSDETATMMYKSLIGIVPEQCSKFLVEISTLIVRRLENTETGHLFHLPKANRIENAERHNRFQNSKCRLQDFLVR